MNTFVNSPDLAMSVAHRRIAENVREAQERAQARAARAERRAERSAARRAVREAPRLHASPTGQYHLPWWAFRFARPVH